MDLPWDDSQEGKYGQSFKAWSEAEFSNALRAIKDVLPHNDLAYVVFHSLSYFL